MSTLLYSVIEARRMQTPPLAQPISREEGGPSNAAQAPNVSGYVDMVAALVPAEVLALHGLVMSTTTTTAKNQKGELYYHHLRSSRPRRMVLRIAGV